MHSYPTPFVEPILIFGDAHVTRSFQFELLDLSRPAVSLKALVHKWFCKTLDHGLGNTVFFQFFEFEFYSSGCLACGIYRGHQISIDVGFCGLRVSGCGWERIALCASRANNPSRQYAAIGLPIFSVEYHLHEVMLMAGEHVHGFVRIVLHFEQHLVNPSASLNS